MTDANHAGEPDEQAPTFRSWNRQRESGSVVLAEDRGTCAAEDGLQIPDGAAERAFQGMWDEEWQKNLVDAALEKVKRKVPARQYQIFYLHSVKNMPAADIARLL